MYLELTMLIAASGLGLVQLFAAAQASTAQRGAKWNVGARDGQAKPLTGIAGRLDRAFANFKETFPFFVAAIATVVCAGRLGQLSGFGSILYVVARVAYVPLYAAGVPIVRSLVWLASVLGIVLVFAQAVFA